jgi:hypothetical protein
MNIPTAEDFFAEHCVEIDSTVAKQMIEFAKLHVTAALNEAANEADVTVIDVDITGVIWGVDVSSILNAYPLTNIK